MYKRSTQTAFAAMSVLADAFDGGATYLSAAEIADRRNLQLPFLSKILTELVQSGIVKAARGPRGGFTLAREPGSILLHDVFILFEPQPEHAVCPFGGGICGEGDNCPLHDRFSRVQDEIARILRTTNFDTFRR